MEPKPFDVWLTKAHRLVFILMNAEADKLCMLWWDESDKQWFISSIYDRLDKLVESSVALDRFMSMSCKHNQANKEV